MNTRTGAYILYSVAIHRVLKKISLPANKDAFGEQSENDSKHALIFFH